MLIVDPFDYILFAPLEMNSEIDFNVYVYEGNPVIIYVFNMTKDVGFP